MAKQNPNAGTVTAENLSGNLRKALQALKRPVMDAARQFGAVRERLAEIAPRVVKLFTSIQAENERVTFVDFCRMFDSTIPTHAADRNGESGYRNHRTYYTLQYMRRIVQLSDASRRPRQQGVRDSAADALARTLATVLQVVGEPEQVWTAIQQEFGFTERLMGRLRKRVEATRPLFTLKVAKPAHVGNVIHMESARQQAETEPMRQPGRVVSKRAA